MKTQLHTEWYRVHGTLFSPSGTSLSRNNILKSLCLFTQFVGEIVPWGPIQGQPQKCLPMDRSIQHFNVSWSYLIFSHASQPQTTR